MFIKMLKSLLNTSEPRIELAMPVFYTLSDVLPAAAGQMFQFRLGTHRERVCDTSLSVWKFVLSRALSEKRFELAFWIVHHILSDIRCVPC